MFVDKGNYSPCSTVGGPLSSSDSLLSGKLLSSLVSAVAAWLCLSFISLAVFFPVCYLHYILFIVIIIVMS